MIATPKKWTTACLGVVFFFSTLSARAEDKATEIVFAAHNLRNYLMMERRVDGELVEKAPKPEDEIRVLVEMLTEIQPDILGVVEIGTEEDLEDLRKRLSPLEFPFQTLAAGSDESRRMGLLSRFPIEATAHQTDLRYPIGRLEVEYQRGILDATIAVNEGYRLRVLGTHLRSKREVIDMDQALMRRNEAHLLRRHIDGILGVDITTNLLVFGDFNDDRHTPPITTVKGSYGTEGFLKDVQLADENGHRWTYYWSHSDQYSRFDYLFASKGLFPEIVEGSAYIASHPGWFTASDHRPLVVRIRASDVD